MAMNPRLLRPRASGHPEAAAWRQAVIDNGGSVSGATLNAVSKFCRDIDAAGLRDRFYRLNLFAGTGLNACLVPLYRGPTPTGAQYGNTTDINNGPFVTENYAETGASGGLQGNGSSKFLDTGLPMNFTTPRDYHLSAVVGNLSGNVGMIGADTFGDGTSPRFYQGVVSFTGATRINVWYNIGTNFRQSDKTENYSGANTYLGTGNASGNALYVAGTSVGTALETGAGTNANTYPIYVFGHNNRNLATPTFLADARISAYSAGLHMSAAQVTAFESALSAFRIALGRA
jgi:hypothetical protein